VEKGDKTGYPLAWSALPVIPGLDAIGLKPRGDPDLVDAASPGRFCDERGDVRCRLRRCVPEHDLQHVQRSSARPPRCAAEEGQIGGCRLAGKAPGRTRTRRSASRRCWRLSENAAVGRCRPGVYAILNVPRTAADHWISDAAVIAAARHDAGFLKAVFAAHPAARVQSLPAPVEADRPTSFQPLVRAGPNGKLKSWKVRHIRRGQQELATSVAHTGKNSVKLHPTPVLTRAGSVDVKVTPNTEYRLSGWIKTDNVQRVGEALGALLNVHGTDYKTQAITGTND